MASFDLPELRECGRWPPVDMCSVSSGKVIDGFFFSRQAQVLVLGPEVTVPMEENVASWRQKKTEKYRDSLLRHVPRQWSPRLITVEVGARGYIPHFFRSALRDIGFSNKEITRLHDKCSYVARVSSLAIWLNRFNKEFVGDSSFVKLDVQKFRSVLYMPGAPNPTTQSAL